MADRQDVAPLSPEEIEAARSFHAVTYSNVELGRSAFEVDALIARLLATIADRDATIEGLREGMRRMEKLLNAQSRGEMGRFDALPPYVQHKPECGLQQAQGPPGEVWIDGRWQPPFCTCGLSSLMEPK